MRVEARDLTVKVNLSGEIYARSSADIAPPALGRKVWEYRISSMIEEGQEVEEGDELLSFDTARLEERLLKEVADRDSSQQSLEKKRTDLTLERETEAMALAEAESRLRRYQLQSEVPEEVISARELDLLRLDLELAQVEVEYRKGRLESLDRRYGSEIRALEARLARQQLDVNELEEQIRRMTLYAPRAGTVLYRMNWEGNKKKVGDSVWRMETILRIPDLETLAARGYIDEAQAGRLALGQRVTIQLDAHPDREYQATVRSVQRTVQRRSWRDPRKVVAVDLEFDAYDEERMRPGMRLNGSVEVETLLNVLAVPIAAVDATREQPSVVVDSLLGRTERLLDLGRTVEDWVEVKSGLSAGERIVLPGGVS